MVLILNILGLDPTKPPRKDEEEGSLVFKALFMDEIVSLDDSDDDSISLMCDEINKTTDVKVVENKQVDEIIELSDEENETDRNWKEKLSQNKTSTSPPPFKEQRNLQPEILNNISPPASTSSSSSDGSKEESPIPPESHSSAFQMRPCIVKVKKLEDDFIDNFNKEVKRRNSSSSSKEGNKSSSSNRVNKQRDSTSESSRNSKEDKKVRKKEVLKHRKRRQSSNESSDNNNNISRKELPTVVKNQKESLKNLKRIKSIVDADTTDDEKSMPVGLHVKVPSNKKEDPKQRNKRVIGSDSDELECIKTSNPSKILIRRKSVSEAGEAKKSDEIKKNDQTSSTSSAKTLQMRAIAQYKIPMRDSNKVDEKIAEPVSKSRSKAIDPYEFNDSSNSPIAVKERKMPARRMTISMGGESSSRNKFQSKPVPIIDAPRMPKRRSSVYDPNPESKASPKRRLSTFEPNVSKKRRNSVFEPNKGEFDMFAKASDLRNNSKKPLSRRISTDELISKEEDKRRKEFRKEKLREITEKNRAQTTATKQKQNTDQEETKQPKVQTKEQLEVIAAKTKTKYTPNNRGAFLAALEPAAATKPPMKLPVASRSALDAANNKMDRIANEDSIKSFRQQHVRVAIVNATVRNGISEDVEFEQINQISEELNRKIMHRRDTVELPTPEESIADRVGFYNQIHFSQEPHGRQPEPQPLQMLDFPVSVLKGPSNTRRRVNRSVSFKEDLVETKIFEPDEPDHPHHLDPQENVAQRPFFSRRFSEPNPPIFPQMNFDLLHHQLQVNSMANNAYQNMAEFSRNFDNPRASHF